MINIGDKNIVRIYKGNKEIKKIIIRDKVIYTA